ncbi:MAG: hypothetical protein WD648_02815 [Planctomycetaceae bacterium]
MIPPFTQDGYLPVGIHLASRAEFRDRFVPLQSIDRRFRIFQQIEKLLSESENSAIVTRITLAGSFVTAKPDPNDFDVILVFKDSVLGRQLRPFEYNLVSRKAARRMFGGDIVPAIEGTAALDAYLEFFQTNRNGQRVGVVEIQL